jgi:hypothetical protein
MNFFLRKGGISTLWAQAVAWGLNQDDIPWIEYRDFRNWWLRAAMARGHAQWLLDEQRNQPGECTFYSHHQMDMSRKIKYMCQDLEFFLHNKYMQFS